ncbi:hypothetical protein ACFSLT_22820 [Novosphingobium resinovorum]
MNYMIQATDGMITIGAMVAGGLLDRFPGAKVCVIEGGASWLAALAERMDEVYDAHQSFVRPKLSLTPREIIARQVACSFQTDRAGIMSRSVTGTAALLWGADYPHHEGTFPGPGRSSPNCSRASTSPRRTRRPSSAAMRRGYSGSTARSSRPDDRGSASKDRVAAGDPERSGSAGGGPIAHDVAGLERRRRTRPRP